MTKIMCSPQTQIQNDRSLLRFQIESENTVFKFLQDGSSVRRQFFCLSVNCKRDHIGLVKTFLMGGLMHLVILS